MRALLFCCTLALSACTPRGSITQIHDSLALGGAREHNIHVVSTRSELTSPPFFGRGRGQDARYARFTVSVPDRRETGRIAWRRTEDPDPSTQFLTTSYEALASGPALRQSLSKELSTTETDEIILFVHGFNTNFSEALYRLAQIAEDYEIPGAPILFAWPAAEDAGGYLYARDSALLNRDALVETLIALDHVRRGRLTIVAFSLGNFLTMESLRQLAKTGRRDVIERVDALMLVAPDIDIDLFRMQAGAIGGLPEPSVVLSSVSDRALGLSALLTGAQARLGSLQDFETLEDLGVTVLEVSAFTQEAQSSHDVAFTSPSLIKLLRGTRRAAIRMGDARPTRISQQIKPGDQALATE
ncbi:MAG: alpha/beta hydrolase [Pseudomonadota bacterium]